MIEFGDLISEASERAGIDPSSLNARHLQSIRQSLKFLQIELETDGATAEFRELTTSLNIPAGAAAISLPDSAIDVTVVTTKLETGSSGTFPLSRISRDLWTAMPDRFTTGAPTSYWVSKSQGDDTLVEYKHEGNIGSGFGYGGFGSGGWGGSGVTDLTVGTPILVLYPIPEAARVVELTLYRQHTEQGAMSANVDIARNWLPTLTAGLASRIAEKWNVERHPGLEAKYQTLLLQRSADENNGDIRIGFRGHGFSRRHRHYGGR